MSLNCWNCGTEWTEERTPGRGDNCLDCNAALKTCYQCEFYDDTAYNECRESQAEVVKDKDKSTFCGWFRMNPEPKARNERSTSRDSAEEMWKKLTGGGGKQD
jgi:hypothetical protein